MIYKFVDYDGLRCILKNNTLKFSKPKDFNDPFEFHENLVDMRVSLDHFIQIVEKRVINFTEERRQQCINDYNENRGIDYLNKKNLFENRKSTTRICCFSEVKDNILMWSHYADKHRGACLGFDEEIIFTERVFDSFYGTVKYEEKIVPYNLSEYREEAIHHWILTKSKSWEYEKETRFLIGSNPPEFIKFNKSSIKEILLGCNMVDKRKKAIDNLIFNNLEYSWITLNEMKRSDHEFSLEENNRR